MWYRGTASKNLSTASAEYLADFENKSNFIFYNQSWLSWYSAHTTGLLSDCFCRNSAMLSCVTFLMLCKHNNLAITSTLLVAGLSTLEAAIFFRTTCLFVFFFLWKKSPRSKWSLQTRWSSRCSVQIGVFSSICKFTSHSLNVSLSNNGSLWRRRSVAHHFVGTVLICTRTNHCFISFR